MGTPKRAGKGGQLRAGAAASADYFWTPITTSGHQVTMSKHGAGGFVAAPGAAREPPIDASSGKS